MTSETLTRAPGADSIKLIPRPEEPIPAVALPTLAVFLVSLAVWVSSTALGVAGTWPAIVSILINGVAAFAFFTVAHECSHSSASSNHSANVWLGRLSMPFFAVIGSFGFLRYIHMQHHRFTNKDDGSDPDHYTQGGNRFTRIFLWASLDVNYLRFYFGHASKRPRSEKIEFLVNTAIVWGLIAFLCIQGYALEVLLFYVIPARIALTILAWSFDWLPHHELPDTVETNKFRATRNIIGGEWLLTPLLLYQNYHLVHHLHPRIPFYRYIKVWRRQEEHYVANDPAMATPLGRPVTADEYRELRHLEEHHG